MTIQNHHWRFWVKDLAINAAGYLLLGVLFVLVGGFFLAVDHYLIQNLGLR